MKFRVFIVFVFFVCCLLPGISLSQNKVVVIPLDSGNCDCNVIPTVTSAGQVWMDRNLGSPKVAQAPNDYAAYGWLYQWGRLPDGHEIWRIGALTPGLSSSDIPGHPFFITAPDSPYDWRSPQNPNLWQGVSGINNPCPAGFRVPTIAEWETERASWSSNNALGAFASPLKLVQAGYRSGANGTVSGQSIEGSYWSSTVSDNDARTLFFISIAATTQISRQRAEGLSVRCIKD